MKTLAKGAYHAAPVVVRYAGIGIQFLVVVAVTRRLSMDDAGVYLSLSGGVQATFFAAGLGIPDGLVRTYGELAAGGQVDAARSLLRRGIGLAVGLTVALSLLAATGGFFATGSIPLALLFASWWLSYGLMFVTAQALVAVGRSRAGATVFYGLINAGLLLVLVPGLFVCHIDSLDGAVALTVVGAVTALVPSVVLLVRPSDTELRSRPTTSHVGLARTFSVGAAMAANRVIQGTLIWSPVWIAGALYGPATAATVAVASRLAGVVGAALAAVNFSIRPDIVKWAAERSFKTIRRRLIGVSVAAGGLVMAASIANLLIGPEAIAHLFGDTYAKASKVLAILLVASFAEALSGASSEVVRMIGSPVWLLVIQSAFTLTAAVSQATFGMAFGVGGQVAAFSTCVSLFYAAVSLRTMRLLRAEPLEPRRG